MGEGRWDSLDRLFVTGQGKSKEGDGGRPGEGPGGKEGRPSTIGGGWMTTTCLRVKSRKNPGPLCPCHKEEGPWKRGGGSFRGGLGGCVNDGKRRHTEGNRSL